MIQENIFSKNLMDISIYPFSSCWSMSGVLAVMTKSNVHVYLPHMQHMSMFKVRWMTIDRVKSAVSIIQNDGKLRTSTTRF